MLVGECEFNKFVEKNDILKYNTITSLISKGTIDMFENTNKEEFEKILDSIDLDQAPPVEEPMRQYYFMKKARKYVKQKSEEIGRPLFFSVVTFGCQMNARDSEKLRGILKEIGYEEQPEETADFVIYNTCTVRENANTRVYGRLGQLKPRKKKNPNMMIGRCG